MVMSKKGWIGSILLLLVLVVGWWLISPLFIDEVVTENVPVSIKAEERTGSEEMAKESLSASYYGTFMDGDGVHHASGDITSYVVNSEKWIRFENFEVTNGPDLYAVLVKDGQLTSEGTILGKLKGNIGSQNYRIPYMSLAEGDQIVIWCKAFQVDFGKAELVVKE